MISQMYIPSTTPSTTSLFVHTPYEYQTHLDTIGETCKYKSRKCNNLRAVKRNGTLHSLCEFHRSKANSNQRKLDRKRRVRSAPYSVSSPPTTAVASTNSSLPSTTSQSMLANSLSSSSSTSSLSSSSSSSSITTISMKPASLVATSSPTQHKPNVVADVSNCEEKSLMHIFPLDDMIKSSEYYQKNELSVEDLTFIFECFHGEEGMVKNDTFSNDACSWKGFSEYPSVY